MTPHPAQGPLRIAILTGEESGDQLAGALMRAVNARRDVVWYGVGGDQMAAAGLASVFPIEEIAVMGFDAIVRRLPQLLRRIREAADGVAEFGPDALVIVDAPEFTHRVAKRVRRRLPEVPVVNYVSPTVWAWRPGRAKAMRAYVDLVLALFPFEPATHRRLGGPACVYVGHPLYAAMARGSNGGLREALLLLPGSRRGEVERLMPVFGETLRLLAPDVPVRLLAVPWLRRRIEALAASWSVRPEIVGGEEAKREAFGSAKAALAASGTVTLELAAARVPMVVAYKLDLGYKVVRWVNRFVPFIVAPSFVLANIVVGRNAVPAFLDTDATPAALADALRPLLTEGSDARGDQLAAFDEFADAMETDVPPGEAAADALLALLDERVRPAAPSPPRSS